MTKRRSWKWRGGFPNALMGKRVLRLEVQLRRKVMKKWVKHTVSSWAILRYAEAVERISLAKKKKTRERINGI